MCDRAAAQLLQVIDEIRRELGVKGQRSIAVQCLKRRFELAMRPLFVGRRGTAARTENPSRQQKIPPRQGP
jgi:hypothetical protein